MPYGLTQLYNIASGGSTTIHQHKCLLVVHAGGPHGTAFPPALVNQPAGWNLLMFIIYGIMGHLRILHGQAFILLSVNNGVHKEAASIALHLRIGQFGLPNADDGLAQLLWRGVFYSLLQQC